MLKIFDDLSVVNDFVQDIDGLAVNFKGLIDYFYCPNHPSTKSTGLSEDYLHRSHPHLIAALSIGANGLVHNGPI
jgi:hypothetical protein